MGFHCWDHIRTSWAFNLLRAPFPREEHARDSHPKLADLIEPFRDANFLRAVLFYGLWTLALGLAGPLQRFYAGQTADFLHGNFYFQCLFYGDEYCRLSHMGRPH